MLDRGHWALALETLKDLRRHERMKEFDPQRQADYSYAVLLQQASDRPADWRESSHILAEMLDDVDQGRIASDAVLLLIELASAMILLREPRAAAAYAQQAIDRSNEQYPTRSLAFQNLGRAQFDIGELADATAAYLRMIDAALRADNLTHAGIAAEWLARISVRQDRYAAAAAWGRLAREVYGLTAPRHLYTMSDLNAATSNVEPAPLSELPPQAAALHDRVPSPSDIGERAGLHVDILMFDLGGLHLAATMPRNMQVLARIPFLPAPEPVWNRFARLLKAEAEAVLPHRLATTIVGDLATDLWPDLKTAILERLESHSTSEWRLIPTSHPGVPAELQWRSASPWPLMFGLEMRALAVLLQAGFASRKETIATSESLMSDIRPIPEFVNFSDRAWPRPLQTWMIVQGQAAAGGEMGPAHLAEEVTRRRVLNERENVRGFEVIGYTRDEASTLHHGKLVSLLATELTVPGGLPPRHIGTTPLNELNIANLPNGDPLSPSVDESRPGFVIDREYNTWFFAPSSRQPDRAWYGKNNELFRDHFSPFHRQVNITGSLRAKHYAIPIIDVQSREELDRVASLLNEATERLKPTKHVSSDARPWYRGQTRGYLLNRPEIVNRYLFGLPSVDEPSLPGAAPRRGWNYMEVHSSLSLLLQAWIYQQGALRGESVEQTHARWAQIAGTPAEWDLGVMLLAQHYGVPTHGIDVTDDINVALWFATNEYVSLGDGQATYRKIKADTWSATSGAQPLIYVILPVTNSLKDAIRDVEILDPLEIQALRPKRQRAAFFMGAHGLHRNRLAEALVCVLRLGRNNWESGHSYSDLFPSEAADPAYGWMLKLKARYGSGELGRFLQEVPQYVPS